MLLIDLALQGLEAVIVNPVFMFGPWDWKPSSGRMILRVASGMALLAPPGGNDFADVRDVAAGILSAAERGEPGRRYILGGEPLSYFEAWRMIAELVGARGPWRKVAAPALFVAGRVGDLLTKIRGREGDVNSAAVAMSRLEHHYSMPAPQQSLTTEPGRPRSDGSGVEMVHRARLRRAAQINGYLPPRHFDCINRKIARASVERHVAASLAAFEFVEDRIMRYTFTPAIVLAIVGAWLLASPTDRALGQANAANGQSAAAASGRRAWRPAFAKRRWRPGSTKRSVPGKPQHGTIRESERRAAGESKPNRADKCQSEPLQSCAGRTKCPQSDRGEPGPFIRRLGERVRGDDRGFGPE